MSRITERARKLVNQAQFDEALFLLLTLNHPTWAEPLRYVCSKKDLTSNSVLYKAKGFRVSLPSQSKTELSEVTLTVIDTDRECRRKLRQMTNRLPGSATLSVVFSGAPDVSETGLMKFQFLSPTTPNKICTFTLGQNAALAETYPMHKYRPYTHPGLFDNAI